MTYIMKIYIDGICRRNPRYTDSEGAIGSAAVVFETFSGRYWLTKVLTRHPRPTRQRVELEAVIMAMEKARDRLDRRSNSQWLDVTIHSDSYCVVDCMSGWI
ncbi:hypothetical protein N7533_009551 [Penicillium manginii]|jgi:ribonuclease HI|uniref:uncharacterized protein n=1 Tax=Penicillium manginii TaxID=203109 RepID=UPI0025498C49|nr:uncharacterized protein N7533_009551 [Penicillium manginii]KAJ5744681.1 hypothetical protein N7533_009551 [Penicillium manginii]